MPDQSIHPALQPDTSQEVKVVINGKEVTGYKGETIINVAAREDVYIPHYCWHPSLSVAGNCRLCLVEVHQPNPRDDNKLAPLPKPVIACQTPISPGMHVFTESELAKECQNGMMEFLLANHPLDCPICDRGGECMLQRYSMEYGAGHARMADKKRKFKKPQFDTLIDIERNRCIMCTRCVRFCDEVGGEHVMGVFDRGEGNYIGTFGRGPVSNILSGNVIDLCPVGCLTSKPFRFKARVWELMQTQSTSIWDASGAKVTHWTRNGKLYRTTPPSRKHHGSYTVNEDTEEFIDNIARFGSDFALHEKRWDESRIELGGTLLPAAFSEAVMQAAQGFQKIKENHGGKAIATLVSPRATMEEGYLAGKLARTVFESDNIDWRMSFQTTKAAEAASLAFEHASGDLNGGFDAVILVNGDYLHQVPTFAMHVKEYARLNNKPIILIGHHHDNYFAPHSSLKFHCAPGQSAKALQLLGNAVKGDKASEGELASLFNVDGERVEALLTTLKSDDVKKGLIIQSLEDMNGAFLPSEVPAAITLRQDLGDNWGYMPVLRDRNAFGLYTVGSMPGRLPAEEAKVRDIWGLEEDSVLAMEGGIPASDLVEAIEDGRIKGLLCLGADALYSHPEQDKLLEALDKLEWFVVSDLFESDITRKADIFIAAASNLERDGTYCDLEGNLARLVTTEGLIGGARPDWEFLTGLATILGSESFNYESVEDAFNEMMSLIAPDFKGSFRGLELSGPENDVTIKDPGGARKNTAEYNPGDYRVDGAHFRFCGEPISANGEGHESSVVSANDGEFLLTWGEHVQGDDYHLNHASIREILQAEAYIEINPADAEKLGIDDKLIRYEGKLVVDGVEHETQIAIASGPAAGSLYVPMGLGGPDFAGRDKPIIGKLEVVGVLETAGVG